MLLIITPLFFCEPAAAGRLALVYNGPVSAEDCPEAVAAVARQAELTVRFTPRPQELPALLPDAAVFILGGSDDDLTPLLRAFTPEVRTALKTYLLQGGRYLGVCGGGFMASSSWTEASGVVEGLGLTTATSSTHDENFSPRILPITWLGKVWPMYVKAGPAFHLRPGTEPVRPVAYFANGELAALVAGYGRGKLALIGPHPEARPSWAEEAGNGSDWRSTTHLLLALLKELLSDAPVQR
jgi:hypothetical protein